MILLDEYLYSTAVRLNDALSSHIAECLVAAIDDKGYAVLALSGGNTPKKMLEALSQKDIPWEKVTVLLVDERWVDQKDERSNEGMLRNHFLINRAKAATFQGYYVAGLQAKNAPEHWENKLGILLVPIDVTVLGMGEDGHTASLFPCASNIDALLASEKQTKIVKVEPKTAPDQRVSLSFPVLKTSKNICVHFTGNLKKEIFQKICAGDQEAPIGHLLSAAHGKVRLYWAP